MYEVIFYEDEKGNSEVRNYLDELAVDVKTNKSARINMEKYLPILMHYLYMVQELENQQ
jgi:DNA-dependent RNA polymerase auxiliary subunit epsilon